MLVGRARFELATNGLKDVKLCLNSSRYIGLNLRGKSCDIGGWSSGTGFELSEVESHRQGLIGVSG